MGAWLYEGSGWGLVREESLRDHGEDPRGDMSRHTDPWNPSHHQASLLREGGG